MKDWIDGGTTSAQGGLGGSKGAKRPPFFSRFTVGVKRRLRTLKGVWEHSWRVEGFWSLLCTVPLCSGFLGFSVPFGLGGRVYSQGGERASPLRIGLPFSVSRTEVSHTQYAHPVRTPSTHTHGGTPTEVHLRRYTYGGTHREVYTEKYTWAIHTGRYTWAIHHPGIYEGIHHPDIHPPYYTLGIPTLYTTSYVLSVRYRHPHGEAGRGPGL